MASHSRMEAAGWLPQSLPLLTGKRKPVPGSPVSQEQMAGLARQQLHWPWRGAPLEFLGKISFSRDSTAERKENQGPERRWHHTGVFQLPPEVLAQADSGAEGWLPSGTLFVLLRSCASTEMPSATSAATSHLPCLINSLLM